MLQNFYCIVHCRQLNVDRLFEIVHRENVRVLDSIVNFWGSNKKVWFSHDRIDDFPVSQDGSLRYDPNDIHTNLSLLLHYDQIYRHPCRLIKDDTYHKAAAFRFATHIAFRILHHHQAFAKLEPWKQIFTLLAIRHNKNLNLKMFALKKTYSLLDTNPSNAVYLRFLKATILDIDMFKAQSGYSSLMCLPDTTSCTKNAHLKQFSDILQKPKYSIFTQSQKTQKMKALKQQFLSILNRIDRTIANGTNRIAVSISGGVDSMLASLIVNEICKDNKNNYEMILLHVCYNNRSCVSKEIELLKYWARKLNSPLYVRSIDEIHRGRSSAFRAVYEEVTRKIRFNFYKHFQCPIILGHNQNDCLENIFSNLSKNIHFDDLIAMSSISIEDENIQLVRPMLAMDKTTIFTVADGFEVPHLVDSTPHWSTRGKMRDILIPQINTFDDKILRGLYAFVKYSKKLSCQWHEFFESWFNAGGCKLTYSSQFKPDDVKHIIEILIAKNKFFNTNFDNVEFWVRIWFHSEMKTRPSNKSFKNLILCIRQKRYERMSLNAYFDAINTQDSVIIVDKNMIVKKSSKRGSTQANKLPIFDGDKKGKLTYQKGRSFKKQKR
eukprot:g7631.t1